MSADRSRVRFAPSPTGPLHLGGLRVALFNLLFARNSGGALLLRIDDTDMERSSEERLQALLQELEWAGIQWDRDAPSAPGPMRQSERAELYAEQADKLLESGGAYRCFCSDEELQQRKAARIEQRRSPHYDGACRELAAEQRRRFEAEGRKSCLRLRWTPEPISFKDVIRGRIEFGEEAFGDFVIIKADGMPTYNFASAVDDALLGITMVIRGDEHIPNTPRQLAVARMLELSSPAYAHLPEVVNSKMKNLNRRWKDYAVDKYVQRGFLPLALLNFLARLGWSPEPEGELLGLEEMIAGFSIGAVGSEPTVFEVKTLDELNAGALAVMDAEALELAARPFIAEFESLDREPKLRALDAVKDHVGTLADLGDALSFLNEPDPAAAAKRVEPAVLEIILESLRNADIKTPDDWETAMAMAAATSPAGHNKLLSQTRLAVTGRRQGPDLIRILSILGRDRAAARIEAVLRQFDPDR